MDLIFFLIEILLGVVAIACLLRFLFQVSRVNPLNMVVASTRRLTDRLLNPFRAVVPSGRFIDTASLLVAWIAMSGRVAMQLLPGYMQLDATQSVSALGFLLTSLGMSLVRLLQYSIWIFIAALVVGVILSWVAPQSTSPYAQLARELPAVLLRPVQRVMPNLGILDFSPMIVLIALFAINSRIIPWLNGLFF
ncbi:MAG: YggT family protein [Gammaproteobacteria bacterium]|nr:YggT family protein [Gammaproteobacteria bacterium]